jgi:hypothetical protein
MAAALGAAGTFAGVGLLAGLPALKRYRTLKLRQPQVLVFGAAVLAIGALGGRTGHYVFLHVARGSFQRRALISGGFAGIVTSWAAWAATYLGRELVSPFKPSRESDEAVRRALRTAIWSGPAAGMVLSSAVAELLKRRARL